MNELSYYEILEISQSADGTEIKKAYKKMAMKYHPDRNQGNDEAEEKFKEINEAYQILSDNNQRSIYDRHGKEGLQGGGGFRSSSGGMGDIFGDIFEDFFGGGGRKQQERRPYELDAITSINLSFTEAIFGCKKDIHYSYRVPCEPCGATGAKGGEISTCSTCRGEGQVYMKQAFMTISQTCPTCRGAGKSAKAVCNSCKGKCYQMHEDSISAEIPEGVDSGMRIRVANRGNEYKGQKGDLYLQVDVAEDESFIRDGVDIYLQVPVFFTDILLEKKLALPSLRGEVDLYLTKNMKDKEQCVFKGQGVKDVRSNRKGNFIVQVEMQYPKKISGEQKELLQQLDASFSSEKQLENGFLDKILNRMKQWAS